MKLLVLHPGHNATAGVFENGQCIEYHHEERFSNLKNHTGFPYRSLQFILSRHHPASFTKVSIPHEGFMPYLFAIPSQKVDYENSPTVHSLSRFRTALNLIGRPLPSRAKLALRGILRRRFFAQANSILKQKLKDDFNLTQEVSYHDHHTCHALTPVFFFGLNQSREKCLLITADGAGGDSCSKIFVYDPKIGQVEKIANSFYPASLGLLYSLTTQYLGMRPGEHEYKVMGLAAYSSEDKYWSKISQNLKNLIYIDHANLTLKSKLDMTEALPTLKKVFDEQRFDNIAAAVQDTLEARILELTQSAMDKTGIRKIAFSGGVFMNVKMNQKIAHLSSVKQVFFQPSCGDESLGIGAATQEFLNEKIDLIPIRSMYTGISHENDEIESFLRQSSEAENLKIEQVSDIEERISSLLSEHKIVARFGGRGEWGARSLCNRAILANASDMRAFYAVNDMVKMRDFWMPFAPTILMDWAPRYISDWGTIRNSALESTKFMIVTVNSTALAQEHLRAAIHQKDKTLRPQIIEEKDNPEMFRILKNFEKKTGMGGIMNTSFNLHGYPLVGNLDQALRTFVNSGLRFLAMGSFLISKGSE